MKKRIKWIIPVCIAGAIIIAIIIGIVRYTRPIEEKNPYNIYVRQYSDIYEPDWELDNVGISSETDYEYARIKVRFWGENDVWNLTDMAHICYTLAPKIRSYMGEEYQSYALVISFEGYAGAIFQFIYYDTNKRMIAFDHQRSHYITLAEIIEAFPDMTSINTDGSVVMSFDDLKSIEQLESLQDWWCFRETMPENWKEYIWSIFPDCEIRDLSNYWEIEKVPW